MLTTMSHFTFNRMGWIVRPMKEVVSRRSSSAWLSHPTTTTATKAKRASSSSSFQSHYQFHLNPNEIFYFAYGANMFPDVMMKRKIKPRLSCPARVMDESFTLLFDHRGGRYVYVDRSYIPTRAAVNHLPLPSLHDSYHIHRI